MKNLIVRSITGVLFVVIIVVALMDAFATQVLFALVTGLAVWEYTGLVNNVKGVQVNRMISTVAGVYFFLAVGGFCSGTVQGGAVFVPYLLTVVYLFISELYAGGENPVNDMAYTMLGQMYIALPLSTINVLAFNATPDGAITFNYLLPLSVFIFLWANDTGAYCTGSLIGKHKLFPRVSPGKTWEGSIGGAVVVLVAAAIIAWYDNETAVGEPCLNVYKWLGLGLVVVVFGTWGDLVESLFKRTLGIKDSGNILPGHGGMLDRFDSSLMAMPAAVLYIYSLSLF